jgi:CubicO group peptidase (beta-lactamase class C family)
LAGKIISQSSLAQMSTITLLNNGKASGPEASSSLGLGWFVKDIYGKKTISHTGHTGTALHIFPEQDLIVVFLSNLSFGISLLNDRGYPLSEIADQIAGMAVKKYGGQ